MNKTETNEPATDPLTAYGSNAFHLSRSQWIVVSLLSLAFVLLLPSYWKRLEKFEIEPDYRVPYELSNDYWFFERYATLAAARYETLVIGDSVVWGQYVTRQQTLTHYLNAQAGRERFANLGLDGAHPLALAGLLEYYGAAITGKNVLLLCNPLWMSSAKHDLQIEEEFRFNHPRLVPQFVPPILCYKEQISARLGVVVERNFAFNAWTSHLQMAYFEKSEVPAWTLEHPYENPLGVVTLKLPPSDNVLRHEPIPWTANGIKKQDFPFVQLESSLQWHAFQHLVEVLRQRGNNVVVMVGPLNEHMLTQPSVRAYNALRRDIANRLRALNVECRVPEALPSELYADASHPLSAGYELLARQLLEKNPALQGNNK